MTVNTVESFSTTLIPHRNPERWSLVLHSYDHGQDVTLLYEHFSLSTLVEAAGLGDACYWAWVTTGLVGVRSFLASQQLTSIGRGRSESDPSAPAYGPRWRPMP